MTALRRTRPLRAPRVSSSAVGRISPAATRPPVRRMSSGSSLQATLRDTQPIARVPARRTYARYSGPRGLLGSTWGSLMSRLSGMALKERVADLSYWIYDHGRPKSAFTAAAQPGTAANFSGLGRHKYALLVTFRKDGTPVPTPVWFAVLDDGRFVTRTEERTAKVRR